MSHGFYRPRQIQNIKACHNSLIYFTPQKAPPKMTPSAEQSHLSPQPAAAAKIASRRTGSAPV